MDQHTSTNQTVRPAKIYTRYVEKRLSHLKPIVVTKGTRSISQIIIAITSMGKTIDPRTTEYLGDLDTMQILETRDGQAGY